MTYPIATRLLAQPHPIPAATRTLLAPLAYQITQRESQAKGVPFSGPGCREHAARRAQKVTPWIQSPLK